jgi:hypothetical protein
MVPQIDRFQGETMMRNKGCLFTSCAAWLLLALPVVGAETRPAAPSTADLAKRIHKMVMSKLPKKFEDLSHWGRTILPPPVVRFPRLRRVAVKVGNHWELPDGNWTRTLLWVPDPNRNLLITVPAIKKIDKDTTRVSVDATVVIRGQGELQKWVNGVQLLDVTADADAVVRVSLDVDVKVAFDLAKPLDGVKVSAKVPRLELDLKEFNIRRVGPVMPREQGPLAQELKGALQARLKEFEPKVKDYANKMIAKEVESGKGIIMELMDK